jgi:pimeloyl-ACP methyl ester carboxylesterase
MYNTYGEMLLEPYCGRRTHDLLCVLDLLAAKGCREVHLVGRGLGAVWATFAAVLHPLVKQVTLHNALLSYHELTQTPVQRWPASVLVPEALKAFDLPDCLRALKPKQLRLVQPWTAQRAPWKPQALREHLKALGLTGLRIT